ncbi:hypothetical protein BD324DRAFT_616686 [Kockovaella imperatae]|uniref:Borealin N-terminal domain-containing protein n=1 Tax=Kockovaella imperatae TaxID=4999 RepID=A0A1Y1UQ45_9TREE|nr:hypothetical protein BD324DRAFT_616686 [Kockovaella imperatae]ORX40180.1 hypothetical protein BD324DRAFT_616686 [Kockovaella imperatae]
MSIKVQVPIIALTPAKGSSRKPPSKYSESEKQSLLDNFDLEVADRTNRFRDSLSATLESFLIRQETEMLKIPRELRNMTLDQLSKHWGGGWKETMQRIAKDRIDAREKEQEAETRDKALNEGDKGKRKRGTNHSVDSTPIRGSKTARRAQTPSTNRIPLAPSSASNNSTSRRTGSSRPKPSASTSLKPKAGPSSLPQNHPFNPSLPLTANLKLGSSSKVTPQDDYESESAASDISSEDESDLPDADEYEARVLAKSTSRSTRSKPSQKSSKGVRRAPSLMFRQSIGGSETLPISSASAPSEFEDEEDAIRTIALGNGREVTFNPFRVNPAQLKSEIAESGALSAEDQDRIAAEIKEEIIKALTERMGKWKIM